MHILLVHGPRSRQSMVDHGDLVVNSIRIGLVAVNPLLENGLIVKVEGKTGGVVNARPFETARFDFEQVIVAVAILVDPLSNRIARIARLDLLGPVAAVGEDAPNL